MFNDANFSHRSDFSSQTFPRYGSFFHSAPAWWEDLILKFNFRWKKGESSKSCRGCIRAVRIKLVSDFFSFLIEQVFGFSFWNLNSSFLIKNFFRKCWSRLASELRSICNLLETLFRDVLNMLLPYTASKPVLANSCY